jgi:hypothetical protein
MFLVKKNFRSMNITNYNMYCTAKQCSLGTSLSTASALEMHTIIIGFEELLF